MREAQKEYEKETELAREHYSRRMERVAEALRGTGD